ncbi:MAG: DUF4091 domain-containing protein [Thermoguttaceae bacterium]|nr:DUF4091 domain-containing protein [Thermoguttaceae bacterium]
MKKTGLFHKLFLAFLGAAAWLGTAALGAIELEVDPALGSKTNGIYESHENSPETFNSYSRPFDVVPGGLYRFAMNACWFGDVGGCFPAGVEELATDFDPDWSEEPDIPCVRMVRMGDNRHEARLAIGRWASTRTIRFTEPTLVPACPIYKMIPAKDGGAFLALGSGEEINGTSYTFDMCADKNDGNFARTLQYADMKFNSDRWCFLRGGQSVVYRFDLRPRQMNDSQQEAEPLRFVSAKVSVGTHDYASGRCLVEMSADGQKWYTVGTLEEKGSVSGAAEELFASPVETLYVRCRADQADSEINFEIIDLNLTATLDRDNFSGVGECLFAECTENTGGAYRCFEVTPLYFDREMLFCRVTNKTDSALDWPAFSYTFEAEGEEPAECGAAGVRVGGGGPSLAPGQSALFAVDLSRHPAGEGWVEKTCRFDKTYRIFQRIFPCFIQDYTYPLSADGALDLSWCEADRKVPRSPWQIEMKQPEPIAIAAPRNDFEAFQIVVRPKEDLANLTAESSELTGPDGAVIPSENVKVRWGYYHQVVTPSDESCVRGWYVDALVPITVGRSGEIGAPLTVAAGENQPIFVTVYVPYGIPKGDYTGEVTLRAQASEETSQTVVRVPYKLTVWDFDQPKKNRFETAYGFSPWDAFGYQNISEESDRRAVWEKYLKQASDHRISLYSSTPLDGINVTFDTENLTANFDFTAFDAEMTRVLEKYNITNFIVPVQGVGGGTFQGRAERGLAGFAEGTPEYDKLMKSYYDQLQEHLREKGWLSMGYSYWFDEPEEKDYEYVAGGLGLLKKYAPDLPRMLTEEPSDPFCDAIDAAGGNIDIWCPISNCFSLPEAKKRMAKGERFWWYVCCGPRAPYCTEFTDHPAHELRLWHWQAFQRGITGSLIWTTNYWTSSTAFPDSRQDPYVDPMSYVTDSRLAPGEKQSWGNGEARYFYPPLSALTCKRGSGEAVTEDPVDSIRFEELREGIEDYEMLLTLRERFEAKKDTLSQEQREEIEKLFDFSDITTSVIHFTDDPAVILAHRARVAEAILRLGE